jgi:type IV pilus assembly protein PilA
MNKKQKGFSLIELLIVVAIILIIAAIAIPNLLRSRMAANEASAVGSIRTMNTAAITYNSTYGNGFPTHLLEIGGASGAAATCDHAVLLDSVLGGSDTTTKSGYTFQILDAGTPVATAPTGCALAGSSAGYVAIATPVTVGTTGQRSFCSDASGVIRYDATGATFTVNAALCSAGTGVLGQ